MHIFYYYSALYPSKTENTFYLSEVDDITEINYPACHYHSFKRHCCVLCVVIIIRSDFPL